ncbi:MAG: O-antigen ligase family protein [Microgenomates group bacterium]
MKNTALLKTLVLFFFLLVLALNPPNKILMVLFVFFSLIFFLFKKNLFYSLFVSYLISSFLPHGKTYFYQIMNLDFLPQLKDEHPFGLIETIKFTFNDIFTILIFFHLIRTMILEKINPIKLVNKVIFVYILFLIFITLSNFIKSPNFLFSFYLISGFFKILIIYFYLLLNKKYLSKYFLIELLAIIGFFQSYLAIIQFLNGAPLGKEIEAIHNIEIFGKTVDEIPFYYRPTGTFTHANLLAGFLLIVISLILYLIINYKKISYCFFLILFLNFFVLILTLSRSAFYSFLIFITILFTIKKNIFLYYFLKFKKKINKKIIILLLTIIVILIIPIFRLLNIFSAFESTGGFYTRSLQIIETIKLLSLDPFFGTGTGFSVSEAIRINPYGVFGQFPSPVHNYYLLLAVENGLPALGIFIYFLFLLFFEFWKKNEKILSFLLISLCFYSIFQPMFYLSEIFYFYAIISKYEKFEKN